MAQYLTNSTARIGFVFEVDGVEQPASAITVTVLRPDGTEVVTDGAGTLTPGTSGTYYYDVPHTTISTYTGQWTQIWEANYGGQLFTRTLYFTVGTRLSAWSMSNIRRKIAKSLRDYWLVIVTDLGTNRQVIDTARLYHDSGFFARAWVRSFYGTESNLGLERQCVSFSASTMTLAQALATTTAVGDRFDAHRRWSFEEYREAINNAIDTLFPKIYLPVVDEYSITTVAGQTDYDISNLQYPVSNLGRVEIETTTGRSWAPHTPSLDPDRATLRLDGSQSIPGGKKLRISYEARIPRLINEWDVLECDESRSDSVIAYLTYKIPVFLFTTEISHSPSTQHARAESLIEKFEERAKDALESVRMRRLPGQVIPGGFGAPGYGTRGTGGYNGSYFPNLVD